MSKIRGLISTFLSFFIKFLVLLQNIKSQLQSGFTIKDVFFFSFMFVKD